MVDGIDISTLRLVDVRQRIFIVPQDPFLLSGTVRSNLNMSGDHSDETPIATLRELGLDVPLSMSLAPDISHLLGKSNTIQTPNSVIVIAHRLSTVIDFDELLVLDGGRIVERGRPIDLSRQSGPFRELLEHSVDRLELFMRLERKDV
ncbi:ABC bile acid transporter, partial [Metarhizium majus ARSEF 297]